jgi:hypothetical protein
MVIVHFGRIGSQERNAQNAAAKTLWPSLRIADQRSISSSAAPGHRAGVKEL